LQLTTAIEDLTAGSARLHTEIKNIEKEVAENQEALDQATEIRQKELAEFNTEEKDLLGNAMTDDFCKKFFEGHGEKPYFQKGGMSKVCLCDDSDSEACSC